MPADIFYSDKPETSSSQNKIRVLELIRDKTEITRADIIKYTQLSAPTVTRIIEVLLEKKIIKQDEMGSSKGGRPPQIIRFDSKNNHVIGIDIGGTTIRAALSNLDGEFSFEIHRPTAIHLGFEGVMEQVGELLHKLIHRAESKNERVFGIGVSVRGLVNNKTGIVSYSPVFQWKNVDIKKALSKFTDLRITLGNDAQLIALGELFYGIGKNYDNFVTISLGFGIGSGIVVNRQPFYGGEGYSGEIGHIIVDPHSKRPGTEGIYGTLEALASGYGIADIAREKIIAGEQSSLSAEDLSSINTKLVIKAAIEGDALAISIIDTAADYIGISIDAVIKLFNPEAISLSGGILRNNYLIEKIRRKVDSVCLFPYKGTPIIPSSFGEEAALMGAVSATLQNILRLE